MLTTLKIECIGNPRQGISPAWVKEVLGINIEEGGLTERPLRGQTDYSEANSVGSRGVYKYFFLQENRIYHVSSPQTWKRTDEFYCRVDFGKIIRMKFEQVVSWWLK